MGMQGASQCYQCIRMGYSELRSGPGAGAGARSGLTSGAGLGAVLG